MPVALTEETQQAAFRQLIKTVGEVFPEAVIMPSWGRKARVDAAMDGMYVVVAAKVDQLPGNWTLQLILGDKRHDPLKLRSETDLKGALSWARGFKAVFPPPWSRIGGSSSQTMDGYLLSPAIREIAWAGFYKDIDHKPNPNHVIKNVPFRSHKGSITLRMKFRNGPTISLKPVRPHDPNCNAIEVTDLDSDNGILDPAGPWLVQVGPTAKRLLKTLQDEHPDWSW